MVVISSSHLYTKNELFTLTTSLNLSGYNDKKIMVVYDCDNHTKKYLKENGWKIYEKKLNGIQVVTQRFLDFYNILKEYSDNEFILSVDSRDVYFHKNPMLIERSDLYIGIDGNCSLEENKWATDEMVKMYPSEYSKIKNNYHLCAGVVMGKNKIVRNLFKDTFDFTFKSIIFDPDNLGKKSTVDQMSFNILAYNKYNYKVTDNNIVINLGSTYWDIQKEYHIYHQYDRIQNFWKIIPSKISKKLI